MSIHIIDDGDEIAIRAILRTRDEMLELAEKLRQRAEGGIEDLTTYIEFDKAKQEEAQ